MNSPLTLIALVHVMVTLH